MAKAATTRSRRPAAGSGRIGAAGPAELVSLVRAGASFNMVEDFRRRSGLTLDQIADAIAVPRRTLTQRKQYGRLKPDESDRFVRLARLFELAAALFNGDAAEALRWLAGPKRALGGETPLQYISTEVGAREVENLIGRLEHGVFS